MGPMRRWLIFLLGTLAAGALLAPWAYIGAQWSAARWPALAAVAAHPFRRYVDRCLLAGVVIGFWWGRRWLDGGTPARWGWRETARPGGRLGFGLVLGLAGTGLLGLALVAGGGRVFQAPGNAGAWGRLGLAAGGSALAVAVLEETVFRGFLFGSVRRAHDWPAAAVFSSLIYAAAHFVTRAAESGPVDWLAGGRLLVRSFGGLLGGTEGWWPEFLLLAGAGLVLALARERSGGLWLPAGLHAGWVLGLKLSHGLTRAPAGDAAGWKALLGAGMLLASGWVLRRSFPARTVTERALVVADESSSQELA